MGNRRRNGAKTFSLLLKEKGATVGEGAPIGKVETMERKTLSRNAAIWAALLS